MALWTLHAAYDPEAQVWYTMDCDVPGLVTESETLEGLRDRAAAVLPELLVDNARHIDAERLVGPHQLRIVAFHEKHGSGRRLMGGAYGRELKRILRAHGCRLVRHGKGDHEIWFSPDHRPARHRRCRYAQAFHRQCRPEASRDR